MAPCILSTVPCFRFNYARSVISRAVSVAIASRSVLASRQRVRIAMGARTPRCFWSVLVSLFTIQLFSGIRVTNKCRKCKRFFCLFFFCPLAQYAPFRHAHIAGASTRVRHAFTRVFRPIKTGMKCMWPRAEIARRSRGDLPCQALRGARGIFVRRFEGSRIRIFFPAIYDRPRKFLPVYAHARQADRNAASDAESPRSDASRDQLQANREDHGARFFCGRIARGSSRAVK